MNFVDKVLNNKYLAAFLSLMIASYAGFAAPTLSPGMKGVLESDMFRIMAVFLISYMSNKNFQVALILSVGLITSLNFINNYNLFGSN